MAKLHPMFEGNHHEQAGHALPTVNSSILNAMRGTSMERGFYGFCTKNAAKRTNNSFI